MVLVSNEWRCNEDDKKSNSTSGNTEFSNHGNQSTVLDSAGAIPINSNIVSDAVTTIESIATIAHTQGNRNLGGNNNVIISVDTGSSTVKPTPKPTIATTRTINNNISSTVGAGGLGGNACNRRFGNRQSIKANKRKMDLKKVEEDANSVMTVREKHEIETCENSGDSNIVTLTSNETNINDDALTNSICANTIDNSIDSTELENNNTDFERILAEVANDGESINSNTNTLQSPSTQHSPTQTQEQQSTTFVNDNVLKSVLSTMISRGQAYNLLGLDENVALTTQNQQQLQQPQTAKQFVNSSGTNNGSNNVADGGIGVDAAQTNVSNIVGSSTCSSTLIVPTQTADMGNLQTSGAARIVLLKEEKSHPFDTRTITLKPGLECKVGRLIAKSKANEGNAIFDCKVLSRNHAVLWYTEDGKFWVKDTKSSNGTYINDSKLGTDPVELTFGDTVKFGVEVMETSRKEMHGCIIAMVKLYLPDGSEAIPQDSKGSERTHFSAGNRISYDEIHRLNAFMQEAAQREKMLKTKLSTLQNVLDTTRKNSALCWQSMISEDQLLHKITLLEKKLQVMEKNAPENTLRNEVMKLLDDKTSYQLTAKEALRKVYQERCDAMQMLATVEAKYGASERECSLLRDQIMSSQQSLQDLNTRLVQLETEYNEYKDEVIRQQQEAKEQEEQRLHELRLQLRAYEIESEELRTQIDKLHLKVAQHEKEQELQQHQAIAKLDAVLSDMGITDDDTDDDDDDEEEEADGVEKIVNNEVETAEEPAQEQHIQNGNIADEIITKPTKKQKSKKSKKHEDLKQKVIRKSNLMQWLKNSDLNQGEDTEHLLQAMCVDSDSGDEQEENNIYMSVTPKSQKSSPRNKKTIMEVFNAVGAGAKCTNPSNFENVYKKFATIFEDVQNNLQRVEQENKLETVKMNDGDGGESDEDADVELVTANDEFLLHGKATKNYLLLKTSVNKLRDTFNEIFEQPQQSQKDPTSPLSPRAISHVQTQCHQTSNVAEKKLEAQQTLMPQGSTMTTVTTCSDLLPTEQKIEMLEEECDSWRNKVTELSTQIEALNKEKSALLAIANERRLVIESGTTEQVAESSTVVSNGNELEEEERISAGRSRQKEENEVEIDKNQLEVGIVAEVVTNTGTTNESLSRTFDEQVQDELLSLNNVQVEREEELVLYKERLEKSESCNLQLRNEIMLLKRKTRSRTQVLIRQAMPIGAVAIAALVYYLTVRF